MLSLKTSVFSSPGKLGIEEEKLCLPRNVQFSNFKYV
jgi:hypothetical protein